MNERTVTSEVHFKCIKFPIDSNVPVIGINFVVSRYRVAVPHACTNLGPASGNAEGIGEDSDLAPPRRRKRTMNDAYDDQFVLMHHAVETTIASVGLQLWEASFLLADYLIYRCAQKPLNNAIIELGSGCGFIGVILYSLLQCQDIYLSDYSAEILNLAKRNICANSHLNSITKRSAPESLLLPPQFKLLDWNEDHLPISSENEFHWTTSELQYLGNKELLILGADIVYDDNLTVKFLRKAADIIKIQSEIKKMRFTSRTTKLPGYMLVSLEKRFNFELDTLSVAAHGYTTFLKLINSSVKALSSGSSVDKIIEEEDGVAYFWKGEQIEQLFPQYFIDYDRTEYLELWRIDLHAMRVESTEFD